MTPVAAEILVGRDDEMRLLAGLLDEVMAGRGHAVWVEGEPGIGKTTLVDHALRDAADRGCQVLRAAADELVQPFPLRLMLDCFGVSRRSADPRRVEIAELMLGRAAGTADPLLAASERLIELVDRLCAAGPVVLIAEDLHWADEASLRLWYRLARAVTQIPLLLVGTCRPVPLRQEVLQVRDATAGRDGVLIGLRALGPAEVDALAGRLIAAAPGSRLREALGQAAGNPLYVRELVSALLRDGAVDREGDASDLRPGTASVPVSLNDAIGRRLGFLTLETRSVLRMAALLGGEFATQELAAVTDRPAAALVPALEEAVAAGVLADGGRRMVFRHGLIAQVLREEIPGGVRAGLHGQIARALADAGRSAGTVAAHLLANPDEPDSWALGWLAGLPDAALYAAPRVAADLLRRGVAQARGGDSRWEALASRLASVLHWLRESDEVEPVASELRRRTADPDLAARMALYLGNAAQRRGRFEQAQLILRQALDDPTTPARWRGRLRAWYAVALNGAGRGDEVAAQGRQALLESEQASDPLGVGYAWHALYLVSLYSTWDDAEGLARLDRGLAVLGDDPESVELRLLMLANRLNFLGRLHRQDEFDATLSEALMLAERAGTARTSALRSVAAEYCYEHGAWDDALAHLDSMTPPLTQHHLLIRYGLLALIAGRRGDPATAAEHLAAAAAQVPVLTGMLRSSAGCLTGARAVAAETGGDIPAAVAILADRLDLAPDQSYDRFHWLPGLVRLAMTAGDAGTARAAVRAAEGDAAVAALPDRVAAARDCRAQLEDDAGALLEVAEYYRRVGRPVVMAGALEEAAVRLAAAGDVPGARAALTEAIREYLAAGASWDIRRADARLRPYGIRRGSRGLQKRATFGWAALTPTEERIARLVAQGKSNPDIAAELYLSRRTVYTHVSHVLAKLDLRSRYDVAREAVKHAATG